HAINRVIGGARGIAVAVGASELIAYRIIGVARDCATAVLDQDHPVVGIVGGGGDVSRRRRDYDDVAHAVIGRQGCVAGCVDFLDQPIVGVEGVRRRVAVGLGQGQPIADRIIGVEGDGVDARDFGGTVGTVLLVNFPDQPI